ncbi:MAG: DeoR/GlpR transcriptional regulator [Rhodospirillales bacterium]|jgi:DeoR/GlpR family transcriptional regulator of sugar metabolism|nr:DeoR/GlpR transcriptional regulator [Rhodospirillales bacterium]MBT4038562.1 DeoR/GlpR transcriptional regulator [Rhodospirillales bacterium]MBT4627411.1 DeoR/GlpR transcriptional regulator [Rhodospirillales bacterium]MBT5351464.1 DeoR/GlpR transcriptional regulator [Rhodospirillales bacterium]MBT5519127.1 DeoR/GlpR transcriptional regulator [Rhodospirillales bacterium]
MSDRLSKPQRQERILERLGSDVTVRISTLAEQFDVTTETIRRDIDNLTDKGLVDRTYGGAASRSLSSEPAMEQRRLKHVAERERIGLHAASLIDPGDVVMIDAGSTTLHFARALASRDIELTVLTNCLPAAYALGPVSRIRVMLCPGEFRETEGGLYGEETVAYLDRFSANKAVISAGGIASDGVTDVDFQASAVKRKMIERATESILLLDHSKYDVRLFSTVCHISQLDSVIVDSPPPRNLGLTIRDARVQLLIAP